MVGSFKSFLRGFCTAWSTESASVKMTIFLCTVGRLFLTYVAAAFRASASTLKFVEYFPVGSEMLDLSL